MKNVFKILIAGSSLAACLSCGSGGGQDSTKDAKDSNAVKMDSTASDTSGNRPSSTPAMASTVSKADANFAVNTADAGMTEIQAGQLAQQKGTAKDVKEYGAMMVKDHTAAADKLKALAAQKNITLPSAISPDMQKNIDDLNSKTGSDFDKSYIDMMISDHKKVISAFEDESKNGSDADIRALVDATLPTLHKHLDKAEQCHKMMKKM